MDDILKVLTRKNSLRKVMNDMSSEEVEKFWIDVNNLYEAKLEEEEIRQKEMVAKQATIDELRMKLKEVGLSVEEFMKYTSQSDKPTKKVAPVYRVVTEEGSEILWTGRGKTPVEFQKVLDETGLDKEEYMIPEEEREHYLR